MKFKWESGSLARRMGLVVLCLNAMQAHASLDKWTLDNGTQATLDSSTGLGWHSFDATSEGEAQGFRLATMAEFDALLRGQGYASVGALPAGMGPIEETPPVTTVVFSPQVILVDSAGEPIDNASLPQAYWDARQALDAEYKDVLAAQSATPTTGDAEFRTYKNVVTAIGRTYGATSVVSLTQETITVPGTTWSPELSSGAVHASLYTSSRDAAFSIEGIHEYDNNYQAAGERHYTYMGQVASEKGLWVGALTSNSVPHQCQPGDLGYNPYGNNVQYCGSRSSSSAYLGPEQGSGFTPSAFTNTDYTWGKKPMGYLMVQSVPEPGTMALMGLGLLGVAGLARRRRG